MQGSHAKTSTQQAARVYWANAVGTHRTGPTRVSDAQGVRRECSCLRRSCLLLPCSKTWQSHRFLPTAASDIKCMALTRLRDRPDDGTARRPDRGKWVATVQPALTRAPRPPAAPLAAPRLLTSGVLAQSSEDWRAPHQACPCSCCATSPKESVQLPMRGKLADKQRPSNVKAVARTSDLQSTIPACLRAPNRLFSACRLTASNLLSPS